MDLDTVTSYRRATRRDDLVLAPGEALLAGGTWLFSEPQRHLTGLVDLTTLGWEPWTETDSGISVAATCSIADLVERADVSGLPALGIARACAEGLLMSWKIWPMATVGGNVCLGLPAAAMVALTAGLDASATIWTTDGGLRSLPVADFVTGPGTTALAPGEVLRSLHIPRSALASRTAVRRISLAAMGRSAALVVGRHSPGDLTLTITAATPRPVQLRFPEPPAADQLAAALAEVPAWYDDPHGAPDWRAAMTARLCAELVEELR